MNCVCVCVCVQERERERVKRRVSDVKWKTKREWREGGREVEGMEKKFLSFSPAYVDVRDLASQLLMERIPLFHEARLDQNTTAADGPSSLPSYLADHTHSSAPSSSLAPRLTNQIAGEGAMAYLLDCYDRSLHESRSTLRVWSF